MRKDQLHIDQLLKQYRDGSISAKDRHELERIALDDPFLFDSMEGYALNKGESSQAIDRLKSKTQPKGRIVNMRLISIAAGIAILIGGLFWVNGQFNRSSLEAISQVTQEDVTQADAVDVEAEKAVVHDSANFIDIKVDDLAGNVVPTDLLKENGKEDESIVQATTTAPENQGLESETELTVDQVVGTVPDNQNELTQIEVEPTVSSLPLKENTNPEITATVSEPSSTSAAPSSAFPTMSVPVEDKSRSKKKQQSTVAKIESVESNDRSNDPFGDSSSTKPANPSINKRMISGLVTDNTGEPLIGVTVLDPKTDLGTATDIDGTFQFAIDSSSKELQIAYAGYADLVVDIDTNGTYDIMLDDSDQVLDEVIVTGYASNVNEPQPSFVLPPGGRSAYKDVVKSMAQSGCDQSGKVRLKFTVTKYGEVTDFEVKKGLSVECNQRAIDIIKSSGQWNNQFNKDKKVRYTISF